MTNISVAESSVAVKKDSKGKVVKSRGRVVKHLCETEWSITCSDPVGISVSRKRVNSYARNFPEVTNIVNPPLIVAGTTIVANGQLDVVCAEPELARDAHDSLTTGELQPAMPPRTVADGLRTALGKLNFEILRRSKVAVVLVDDEAILTAMRLIWNRLKIVVEPSAAVCLAAMLLDAKRVAARAGVILSGGNVSPPHN